MVNDQLCCDGMMSIGQTKLTQLTVVTHDKYLFTGNGDVRKEVRWYLFDQQSGNDTPGEIIEWLNSNIRTEGSSRQALAVVRSDTAVAWGKKSPTPFFLYWLQFLIIIVLPWDQEGCRWHQSQCQCRRCPLVSSCMRLRWSRWDYKNIMTLVIIVIIIVIIILVLIKLGLCVMIFFPGNSCGGFEYHRYQCGWNGWVRSIPDMKTPTKIKIKTNIMFF